MKIDAAVSSVFRVPFKADVILCSTNDASPERRLVEAGRQILHMGKLPTGARLRAVLGWGTPSRLESAWKEHVADGGEGDPEVYAERENSLHAYRPPTQLQVMEAGKALATQGKRVTGHTLWMQLGKRGTPANLTRIWEDYVLVLPRSEVDLVMQRLTNEIELLKKHGIQGCMEAMTAFRALIDEMAIRKTDAP